MDKLIFQDADQSLINHLVTKKGKSRAAVLSMLSVNMVPIKWFCYLASIGPSRVTMLTDPAKPILKVCYPFPQIERNKFLAESGPRFILIDDAAINYIINPKHGHRRFNSKE